jgi:hypothetical protein
MATKTKGDTIYEAFQGGVVELPDGEFSWITGDRLRADHPAVVKLGSIAFVPDGTPVNERPNLFERVVKVAPNHPVRTQRFRATKNVRAELNGVRYDAKKGDLLDPGHELVRIAPDSFRLETVEI